MARPARRRAAGPLAEQSGNINAFVRVSKGFSLGDDLVAKKELALGGLVKCVGLKTTTSTGNAALAQSRKRKASPDSDAENAPVLAVKAACAPVAKRSCRREAHVIMEKTPQQTSTPASAPAPTARKAKPTASKAEMLHHKSTVTSVISSAKQAGRAKADKVKSVHALLIEKHAAKADASPLPAEFAELVELHRSFLVAVTLHIAHNGSNVPIDLREILPNVSRAWGKRAVTVEDVRRCVAVEDAGAASEAGSSSPFTIVDYGRGKICLELDPKHMGAPLNERGLCKTFERNLRAINSERSAPTRHDDGGDNGDDSAMDLDVSLRSLSLADLPQAPISSRAAKTSANPLLSRGQQALAELKNGIAQRAQEKTNREVAVAATTKPDGSKMSVLDRIRLKELAKASAPLPPSAAELERRAALQRVADVAAVVQGLTRSSYPPLPRQAYPLTTLLQKLKDSLRVPTSGEEAAAVVRLIAREVAPEWFRIVTVAGKETVVVQTMCEPSVAEITARAQRFA